MHHLSLYCWMITEASPSLSMYKESSVYDFLNSAILCLWCRQCWSLYICWGFLLMIYLIISYSLCRPYDSSQCGVGIGLHRNLRTPCTPTNKDQQQCTNYMNGIAVLTLCCVPATCSATSRPCWWSGGGKSQNPGDSWWSDSASIPVRWMSSVVPLSVL